MTTDSMNETTPHIEYSSESELLNDFKEYMSDPESLEKATNYLYDSLLDETILGTAFELHYYHKTGLDVALEGEPEDATVYVSICRNFSFFVISNS